MTRGSECWGACAGAVYGAATSSGAGGGEEVGDPVVPLGAGFFGMHPEAIRTSAIATSVTHRMEAPYVVVGFRVRAVLTTTSDTFSIGALSPNGVASCQNVRLPCGSSTNPWSPNTQAVVTSVTPQVPELGSQVPEVGPEVGSLLMGG
jgi:hypothetical protein